MDPFASYTHIATPQQFWSELDDLLGQPPLQHADEQHRRRHAATVLQTFLNLCAHGYDTNLSSEYNQHYAIHRLFDCTALRNDPHLHLPEGTPDLRQLLVDEAGKLAQTATSIPVILLIYEVVLLYGEAYPDTYKTMQASASSISFVGIRAFLHRLVHQIWAGSYAAQAEAKIGTSATDQTSSRTGADWYHQDDHHEEQLPQHRGTAIFASGAPTSLSSGSMSSLSSASSSSASSQLAKQIRLREKAVQILYEVCRVQKLEPGHLKAFDERFVHHLFDLVEETRYHHDEGFNYQLIKTIAAINEQYMVSGIVAASRPNATLAATGSAPPTGSRSINLVLDVLKARLNASKTFGENLIFMLNRASSSNKEDLCMQLLVLKLLYLLFTTKETACYFYTNDLKVLVDIFIRELSDLPDEHEALRHTYLRVLHPLLTNTQLCTYPYKRPQIRRLLVGLISNAHLREVGATMRRLVERCLRAEWCVELDNLDGTSSIVTVAPIGGGEVHTKKMQTGVTTEGLPMFSTRIEQSTANDATAVQIAQAREESEPQLVADDSPPPSSVSSTSGVHSLRSSEPHSASLAVPGVVRSRSKRVLSFSNLRATLDSGAAQESRSAAQSASQRRIVSARSAPPTPPRHNSPDFDDADGDDGFEALSNSSSWHAHMADVPVQPQRMASSSLSLGRSSGEGLPATNATHHPYLHHSSIEAISHPPRIGSPLSVETTLEVLSGSLDQRHVSNSPLSQSTGQTADEGPAIRRGLPSLHVRSVSDGGKEGSDMTVRVGSLLPPAESGPPPQRRRPPEPPGNSTAADRQARRAMLASSSDSVDMVSRPSTPAFGSGSNAPESTAPRTGAISPSSEAAETAMASSTASLPATTSSSSANAHRRRPPPPPPPGRTTKSNAVSRTGTDIVHSGTVPLPTHVLNRTAASSYPTEDNDDSLTQKMRHFSSGGATEPCTFSAAALAQGRTVATASREEEADLEWEMQQEQSNHLARRMAGARIA